MKLVRYAPTRSVLPSFNSGSLLDELDRLFETGSPTFHGGGFAPFPIDVYRGKDSISVRAELPGFLKEEIQVNVANDILAISFHTKPNGGKESPKTETSIERTVALPEGLDYAKVAATYENGVLTVTLPKRPEIKPTTVAVEVK